MRFTTAAVSLIVFIVIFSIFVANVANLVGIDSKLSKRLNAAYIKGQERWNVGDRQLKLDDDPRHMMWFLQVRGALWHSGTVTTDVVLLILKYICNMVQLFVYLLLLIYQIFVYLKFYTVKRGGSTINSTLKYVQ